MIKNTSKIDRQNVTHDQKMRKIIYKYHYLYIDVWDNEVMIKWDALVVPWVRRRWVSRCTQWRIGGWQPSSRKSSRPIEFPARCDTTKYTQHTDVTHSTIFFLLHLYIFKNIYLLVFFHFFFHLIIQITRTLAKLVRSVCSF